MSHIYSDQPCSTLRRAVSRENIEIISSIYYFHARTKWVSDIAISNIVLRQAMHCQNFDRVSSNGIQVSVPMFTDPVDT